MGSQMMGIIIGFVGFIALAAAGIVAATRHDAAMEAKRAAEEQIWDGAVVVAVCRDGTRIFRLRNGEHHIRPVLGRDLIVADPATVCK